MSDSTIYSKESTSSLKMKGKHGKINPNFSMEKLHKIEMEHILSMHRASTNSNNTIVIIANKKN